MGLKRVYLLELWLVECLDYQTVGLLVSKSL